MIKILMIEIRECMTRGVTSATATAPLWSPHVQGWNAVRGCASTTRAARALKYG
jgi:hypothetical protein